MRINTPLSGLFGLLSQQAWMKDAQEHGELTPETEVTTHVLDYEGPEGQSLKIEVDLIPSVRFKLGRAVIGLRVDGQPVPKLEADDWAKLRGDLKRILAGDMEDLREAPPTPELTQEEAWARTLERFQRESTIVDSALNLALGAGAAAIRLLDGPRTRQGYDTIPEVVELKPDDHLNVGVNALVAGQDPSRMIDLASRSFHMLDALCEEGDKPLQLSAQQRTVLAGLLKAVKRIGA